MLFYALLFVVSALFLLYLLKGSNYWKKKNIKEVPFTFWQFFYGNKSVPELYKNIYNENDTHVGIYLGLQPFLILKDLEDVNAVLAGDFPSFYSRGFKPNPNDTLANNVLFLNDYKKWKIIRQKLTPLFTSAKLRNMFYIIDKTARDFVSLLDENTELRSRTYDAVSLYMTASIAAAVFGVDTKMNNTNTMHSPLIDMARKSIQPSFKVNLLFSISNYVPWIINTFNIKFFGEHEPFFVGFVKEVLESRRKEPEGNKRHDFIDMCIELQKQGMMHDPATNYSLKPTDEVMAAQAFFFFIAGIDTSSTTLQFALLELSCNQRILAKVHDEIDSIYENGKKELTYNDVEKLQYLDMVMSEAMRKYPTIGVIQRECTKASVLPASKVQLDKGAGAIIPVLALHRDPKYFPNPEVFDPERFAPENLSKIQKFSYLPFGEGNRICIGSRFARLQMKTGLAWLLKNYTIEEQDYKPKFDKSTFSVRDTTSTVKLIKRNV